jgi:ADP-ribose pyrophosphatase YjhB (NUDIX family)
VAWSLHSLFLFLALRRLLLLLLGRFGLIVHGAIVREVSSLHGWKLCPRCGGDLRLDRGRADCGTCGFVAYASSAPTASALCVDGSGRVLLARRAHEPYREQWDVPGGFLEEGEHPLDGLRRELTEETGLEIEPEDLLGIWMDRYGDGASAPATLNLYWTARVVGGEPVPADDVSELRWFGPDELPPADELAFENTAKVLSAWRIRQQNR